MESLDERMRAAIAAIEPGSVMTYDAVMAAAGCRRGGRRRVRKVVARSGSELPWWRVVGFDGLLDAHDPDGQRRRLLAEGVGVDGPSLGGWRVYPAPTRAR